MKVGHRYRSRGHDRVIKETTKNSVPTVDSLDEMDHLLQRQLAKTRMQIQPEQACICLKLYDTIMMDACHFTCVHRMYSSEPWCKLWVVTLYHNVIFVNAGLLTAINVPLWWGMLINKGVGNRKTYIGLHSQFLAQGSDNTIPSSVVRVLRASFVLILGPSRLSTMFHRLVHLFLHRSVWISVTLQWALTKGWALQLSSFSKLVWLFWVLHFPYNF